MLTLPVKAAEVSDIFNEELFPEPSCTERNVLSNPPLEALEAICKRSLYVLAISLPVKSLI